ncbi:MAG: kinase/pyrophosphorylase [Alphaproteobacteria bacterium]|jgi:regulator of PEP synthase PpsR (kinase-PPPase family)|nr:kinase/pyrophosphorylase [Alphaproteobacteria bacterium]
MTAFHLHLVSDSTGETLKAVARAAIVQFANAAAEQREHSWALVRTPGVMERVIQAIAATRGIVLYTVVDPELREMLVDSCRKIGVPCVAVLDPVIQALSLFLGQQAQGLPGRQHELDAEYFKRIDAMNYTLAHDDGQVPEDLDTADLILLGVSRTSKTPTSIYLANRGVKVVNIPVIPGVELPPQLFEIRKPLVVGLTTNPERLIQIRMNRLASLNQNSETSYVDPDAVREEIIKARRLYNDNGWHVIDVSRRSIEETAAAILNLLSQRRTNDR